MTKKRKRISLEKLLLRTFSFHSQNSIWPTHISRSHMMVIRNWPLLYIDSNIEHFDIMIRCWWLVIGDDMCKIPFLCVLIKRSWNDWISSSFCNSQWHKHWEVSHSGQTRNLLSIHSFSLSSISCSCAHSHSPPPSGCSLPLQPCRFLWSWTDISSASFHVCLPSLPSSPHSAIWVFFRTTITT